jgi:hypothetical protein
VAQPSYNPLLDQLCRLYTQSKGGLARHNQLLPELVTSGLIDGTTLGGNCVASAKCLEMEVKVEESAAGRLDIGERDESHLRKTPLDAMRDVRVIQENISRTSSTGNSVIVIQGELVDRLLGSHVQR